VTENLQVNSYDYVLYIENILSAGIIFFSKYCCVFALSKDGKLTLHNIDGTGNKNATVALADSSA